MPFCLFVALSMKIEEAITFDTTVSRRWLFKTFVTCTFKALNWMAKVIKGSGRIIKAHSLLNTVAHSPVKLSIIVGLYIYYWNRSKYKTTLKATLDLIINAVTLKAFAHRAAINQNCQPIGKSGRVPSIMQRTARVWSLNEYWWHIWAVNYWTNI